MEIKLRDKLSGSVLLPEDISQNELLHGGVVCCPVHPCSLNDWVPPSPSDDITVFRADDLGESCSMIYPDGAIPLLGSNHTLWPGQPVALVCSRDRTRLSEYLDLCEDSFKKVKTGKGSFLKQEKVFASHLIQKGNPEAVIKKSDRVFEETIDIPSSKFMSSQPWSAFCRKEGDRYTVHTASQWPHSIQINGARLLGIRKDRIIVENHPADYVNQNRIFIPTLFACYALLLSSRLNQSVSMTSGIAGNRILTPPSGDIRFHFRMSLDSDSLMESLVADIKYSAGASQLFTGETLDRICHVLKTSCRIPHFLIKAKAVQTQTPPSDGGPLFGSAATFLALDLFLGSLETRIPDGSRLWRSRQSLAEETAKSGKKAGISVNPMKALVEIITELSGYSRKSAAYEQANSSRGVNTGVGHPLRGMGLGFGFSGSNFIRKSPDLASISVSLLLDKDGKLFIKPSNVPCHTELLELWRKIASSSLALPRENIHFLVDPFNGTGILSRNVTMMTDLIKKGLNTIQGKRFREPLPIGVTKTISGNDLRGWDPKTLTGEPYSSISRAAAVVEIILRKGDALPELRKIWLYADCGQLLDEEIARSVLEAEIALAVAWCRLPVIDGHGTGQLFNTGKTPEIDIRFIEGGRDPGGIEGLAFSSVPAAYIQAVNQTLESPLISIPFSGTDIRRGLYNAD
jgi:CO/xanthine dehydrogenase Mo-binding subunit